MPYQCVSDRCDFPIEDGWSFCPSCGSDNRPPAARSRVPEHYHRFVWRNQGYCTICGEPAGEPYMFGYRWRIALTFLCFGAAAVTLLMSAGIYFANRMGANPFTRWVHSWSQQVITHHVRRRYSRSYTYTTTLGQDVAQWALIGGVFLIVVGAMLLFKQPFSRGGNIWDSDRDRGSLWDVDDRPSLWMGRRDD